MRTKIDTMSKPAHDVADEQAMLDRLATAHAGWRKVERPTPPSRPIHEIAAEVIHKQINPEPPDAEMIRNAATDPLLTAICSQLSVLGWRLYAKGGAALVTDLYRLVERDRHPSFAWIVGRAWDGIGFAGDSRGIWRTISLL